MRFRLNFFGFVLLACLALLPACSVVETPRTQRGNKIDPDQLKELVIGTSSKADASSLLGSPTARATFDDNTWIYISELTRVRIGRTPGIMEQSVTKLTFDQGGILRGIETLGQEASRDVAVVSRATPSPGSDASFMQQLLGNVGKFTPTPGGGLGGAGGGSRAGSSGGGQGL